MVSSADFQIALPDDWNGKLVVAAHGLSSDEFGADAMYRDPALRKGYAFVASDEDWIIFELPTRLEAFFNAQERIREATVIAQETVEEHYGSPPERTYLVGGSAGGANTRMILESFPELYDGGISMFGTNSIVEAIRQVVSFVRNYPAIAPRIDDIVAARDADAGWDPSTDPLEPALTAEQVDALRAMYDVPAQLPNGFEYNIGQEPGSEADWESLYPLLAGVVGILVSGIQPGYDPDSDGTLSPAEVLQWSVATPRMTNPVTTS